MDQGLIVVKAAYDGESGVWYVESADVPGLNLEAATMEQLIDKLPAAIYDLLEEDGATVRTADVAIEVIAHASTRLKAGMAA